MGIEGEIRLPTGVGLVIVGRNEGARLKKSLVRTVDKTPVYYVDSGSTDGSPQMASDLGFTVIELDPSRPFTAGRGRNEGFAALRSAHPEIRYVQFQDGDCLIDTVWLDAAVAELDRAPDVVVVAGGLREQNLESSIFNRFLDMEWRQPLGDASKVGGNAMIRVSAFETSGGFNSDLPAGEESDLHLRMRQAGGIIRIIDVPMAFHDADMRRWSQWWQRSTRDGQAAAEAHSRLGEDDPHAQRMQRSTWLWGVAVPAVGVMGLPLTLGLSSVVPMAAYSALYLKILRAQLAEGRSLSDAELYARFMVMAKVPQAVGQIRYHWTRVRGQKTRVIDWRDAGD